MNDSKPDWKSFPSSILSERAKVAFERVKATGEAYRKAKAEATAQIRQDFDKPGILVGFSYAHFGKISLAHGEAVQPKSKTSLEEFLAGQKASGLAH